MLNNHYRLTYLPLFQEDLNGVLDYISENLSSPQAARRLVVSVENAILKRVQAPASHQPLPTNDDRPFPYYAIVVGITRCCRCSLRV
ncbi:plasmid stabilization system protein ParE [Arcanobacterium wilhelmae]|uniref:Plasmid stabilization system protein ParE n=1 Tax=Arcanobacterium wilhelmae TaxID=1803177 RepID=A0ABT9NAQ2_9ACTO|nr:plasmid stabilization system protein ParE [Arcanobacterium wilhelmae]